MRYIMTCYRVLLVKYFQNRKTTYHSMHLHPPYDFSKFFVVFHASSLWLWFSQELIFWNSKFNNRFFGHYNELEISGLAYSTRYNQYLMILQFTLKSKMTDFTLSHGFLKQITNILFWKQFSTLNFSTKSTSKILRKQPSS